jgi:5-methylcytosine-specific restriction enzyme subunit McrC
MVTIVVREFARLTTGPLTQPSLDEACVEQSAFDWLCQESARLRKSGASLVQIEGQCWLRLDNYVGVIETPCGTKIEILPKTVAASEVASTSRGLLRKMLKRCLDVPVRETGPAAIEAFDAPLTEWVMRQFLESLEHLVKRGARFGYHAVEEQQRFLRGRLLLPLQLREPPGRQHGFHTEHDVFDADRPENRLLRSAVERVCILTRDGRNWRLSHELAAYVAPVPPSADVVSDFRRWRSDRLLAHYRPVRPWCALILNEQTPVSVVGQWHGTSLLFPMEKVFEKYVGACLRTKLPIGVDLIPSASNQYLCCHRSQPLFQLKPDFLIKVRDQAWLIDTKWKLIDRSKDTSRDKYGLSQADFYQLYVYGQKYLGGCGDMFLIFPKTADFTRALPPFFLESDLRLWAVPFDVQRGELDLEDVPDSFRALFTLEPIAA